MAEQITLTDIVIDVVLKRVKRVRLSIHPPTGRVRISAPSHMSMESIRVFAISKLDWIKKHQKNIRAQDRVTRRDFVDRESHYVWGKRYLMQVIVYRPPLELDR
ncbi:MAG: M48 family metallopeptidase [Bacteroidales bacterium]|nr:M48 family metallopeptidase [Candidatus Latescibacterota bacterium]